jgi:hypothetical protein
MISLGEKMQVYVSHDRAVGVGIVNDCRRIVPAGQMKLIANIALHSRHNRLKKSLTTQPLGWETLLVFPSQNDTDFSGVRAENADSEILADTMGSKDPERIRMRAREKNVHLVDWQIGYFERAHAGTIILEPPARMSCADFASSSKGARYL